MFEMLSTSFDIQAFEADFYAVGQWPRQESSY